jgi:Dyp-type peroxidase family
MTGRRTLNTLVSPDLSRRRREFVMSFDLKRTEIGEGGELKTDELKLLEDVQGNILKSHGRDHARHLFITFGPEKEKGRAWLAATAELVTSAAQQWKESAKRAAIFAQAENQPDPEAFLDGQLNENPSSVFVNVLLSAKGYQALGLEAKMPNDISFRRGADATPTIQKLADPHKQQWEREYQSRLDALVIVADDAPQRVAETAKKITKSLGDSGAGQVVHVEIGKVLRSGRTGPAREHFGFVDGVSNPLFFAKDIKKAKDRERGFDKYDPRAPLKLVLVEDPGGTGHGSYLVFRKLAQNVQQFNKDRLVLAQALAKADGRSEPHEEDKELAGAYMVGRFRNGMPVVEKGTPKGMGEFIPNNFNYAGDPEGAKCPFQTHIRKVNPRGESRRGQEGNRRIVRRAVSYEKTGGEVGLLFFCAQANIADQFELMQQTWANAVNFVRAGTSVDALIGQGSKPPTHRWPGKYGQQDGPENRLRVNIQQSVKLKGAGYFFAPSPSFLKNAAKTG